MLENLGEEAQHVKVAGPHSQAVADPSRVRQSLRNLINNAIRHGGDHIQITVSSSDTTASLRACDDGPGIPDTVQDQIFEPYYTTRTGSLGLGLNVSLQLAQRMGGDLIYRYQDGESIFDMTLPAQAGTPVPGLRRHR